LAFYLRNDVKWRYDEKKILIAHGDGI
jgi:hypothetical protein